MITSLRIARTGLVLLAFAMAAGCGKKDEPSKDAKGDTNKVATQVAAKVNNVEITVHQVNNLLARAGKVSPESVEKVKREILNRLIDLELAKQQAIEKKLDHNPNVMQAIEAARSEMLARAYLEQVAVAQQKPSEADVKTYYAEHPELFANRRVFNLEEIAVEAKPGLADGLRQQVAKAKSLQDVANWLKSEGAKFAANRGVRAAEQLPLSVLPQIQQMKDGSIQLFGQGDGPFQVIRILASKAAPVDEATATPRINQFLFNRSSSEVVAAEMKRLRDKATIEYSGEFASTEAAAQAKAKAEADAKAKEKAEAQAKAKAEAEAQSEALAKARRENEAKARQEAEDKAEEAARARRETEAKARQEAETKAKSAPTKPTAPQDVIDKGVKGIR